MFDLVYADVIVILSCSFKEMQGLLGAVNCYAAVAGLHTNASKITLMSALTPGEQRHAALLDNEPLKDVGKFNYLGPVFVANGRREISLSKKGGVYQVALRSILFYGCETWSVRVTDGKMLEIFDNGIFRCILHVRRRSCLPSVELRCHVCLTSIPALLVQGMIRWFCHTARRPDSEPIKHLLVNCWSAEDVGNHDQG